MPGGSFAQNIIQAEYFIDNDPGVGSATSITITSGATIDENFLGATNGLPSGSYTIYMRTKDDNGVWGFTEARNFIITYYFGSFVITSIGYFVYKFNQ